MHLRRSFHLLALAITVATAGPALAQGDATSQALAVAGSTPQVCALQNGEIRAGRLENFSGTEGNVLRVVQFVDQGKLSVLAASAELSFAAVCNFAHQVRLESQHNGLWPTDGRMAQGGSGFAYAVPYDATVAWAETSGRLVTDGKANRVVERSFAVNAPYAGDLVLQIDIAKGASNVELNAPVIAGDYADTLRIFLEPR
jgi:hypothetical protein